MTETQWIIFLGATSAALLIGIGLGRWYARKQA